MKELNMKMPLVFRLGIALLCVMLLSTHFTGNLYARYSTTATGSDSARVAKISYKITATNSQPFHEIDINLLTDGNKIVAVEETFTIENDGEVAYDYEIELTVSNDSDSAQFNNFNQDQVYLLASDGTSGYESLYDYTFGSQPNASLYYFRDGSWYTGNISGTLAIGDKAEIKFIYFINYEDAGQINKQIISYDIVCKQID